MLRYIGLNTKSFEDYSYCLATVEGSLDDAVWKPDYSRRLRADGLTFSKHPIKYTSSTGAILQGHFLYLDIHNARPDIAALETTARLVEYGQIGQALRPSHIRSPLKATARPGFAHTIFPRSHEAFDLLCVGSLTTPPSISSVVHGTSATWSSDTFADVELRYEFLAIDFPLLSVTIELDLGNAATPSARLVSQDLI